MLIFVAVAAMLVSECSRPSAPRRLSDLRTPIQPLAMPQPRGLPNANSHAVAILLVERLRADVEAAEEKFGDDAPEVKRLRERLASARDRVDRCQAGIDRLEDPIKRDAAESALDKALESSRDDVSNGRPAGSTRAALERALLVEELHRLLDAEKRRKK